MDVGLRMSPACDYEIMTSMNMQDMKRFSLENVETVIPNEAQVSLTAIWILHCLDSRLTDGDKGVSLRTDRALLLRNIIFCFWYSFLLEDE
jgi:hypothetical protein